MCDCSCKRRVTGSSASERVEATSSKPIAPRNCSRKTVTVTHLLEGGPTIWVGYAQEKTPGAGGNVPLEYLDEAEFEGEDPIFGLSESDSVDVSVVDETYRSGE